MYNFQKGFCSPLRNKRSRIALIVFSMAVLFLAGIAPALATDYGLSYGTYLGFGTQDLRVTIMNIVRIFLGFLGIIALLLVIYAGWLWMSSAGNEEKITQAKNILRNTLIGLAIIMSAFAIVSFIIVMLTGGLGGNGTIPDVNPPPSGCENCGYLGTGIIESVYPAPMSTDNDRDTAIIVTFKEEISPDSVINGVSASAVCGGNPNPCAGTLREISGEPVVKIFKRAETESAFIPTINVNVVTVDKKTYQFIPPVLGDSVSKNWYTVKLTNAISKASDGSSAFPGVNSYFSWDFEVGTKLDVLPPKITSVFPYPDNNVDDYTPVAGQKAQGSVVVVSQPKVSREPSATLSVIVGDTDIELNGVYNGTYEGTATYTVGPDRTTVGVVYSPTLTNGAASFPIDNMRITLGVGVNVVFQEDTFAAGDQFSISFVPNTEADVLQISNKIYRFVSGTPTGDQIQVGSNINNTAANIATKIQSDGQAPKVNATASGATVSLTADVAGSAGNYINVAGSGTWATITNFGGGANQTTSAECSGACDQPRNSVIRLDFSEGIMPSVASGKNTITQETGSPTGVGSGPSFNYVTVQADINNDGTFSSNEYISGTFTQSNQYKTVEFLSLQPCASETSVVTNSCGDPIYCLPIRPNADATRYRVTVKASSLKGCTNSNECLGLKYESGELTETCTTIPKDKQNPATTDRACGNSNGIFYPKAATAIDGIADLASNSFDGNGNGFSQGTLTQSLSWAFALHLPNVTQRCDLQSLAPTNPATTGQVGTNCTGDPAICIDGTCRDLGDDLIFDFWISSRIDSGSPVIIKVNPSVQGSGSSLLSPISSYFNKLLMSSTVKSGTGYKDGRCTCTADIDCADADQKCLPANGTVKYCVNVNNPQIYCAATNECKKTGTTQGFSPACETKEYITLVNPTTIGVGWWLSNIGQDIRMCLNESNKYKECTGNSDCNPGGVCSQADSYFDRNLIQINHTRFAESTQYGAKVASGVKDIYQNCYIPGKGPQVENCNYPYGTSNGCCAVTATGANPQPFCCNGNPQDTPCN